MKNNDASHRMDELKERLAESVRICVREELLESFGHVSARDPESKRIFVLRHLHERLDRVTAQDFIELTKADEQSEEKLSRQRKCSSTRPFIASGKT